MEYGTTMTASRRMMLRRQMLRRLNLLGDRHVGCVSYWLWVVALTLANTAFLGITSAAAGLSLDSYIAGAREVVFLNMLALTLLFWPALALTLRRLHERQNWAWWGLAIHALAVLAFMMVYFGKPFALPEFATTIRLLPTVLFLVVAAWLVLELLIIDRTRPKRAG